MPVDYKKYPKNWKTISRFIRFYRAKSRCEVCGVPNYAVGYREEGTFVPTAGLIGQGIDGDSLKLVSYSTARHEADRLTIADSHLNRKYIVIVLTVAHLDHNTKNNSFFNLKAMCQKCHNDYDKEFRAKNRAANKQQMPIKFKSVNKVKSDKKCQHCKKKNSFRKPPKGSDNVITNSERGCKGCGS